MAEVVIEIHGRDLSLFQRFERFPVRIGRSLENDIILANETVSPFHAEIRESDDGLVLVDLNSDNGTRLNGKNIVRPAALTGNHDRIHLGRASISLADPAAEIAPTRKMGCDSPVGCLLNSPPGALLLFLTVMSLEITDHVLDTISPVQPEALISVLAVSALAILAGFFLMLIVLWAASHRWEPVGSLAITCVLFIFGDHLVDMGGESANYFFNTSSADAITQALWILFLLPLILWLTLTHQQHLQARPARWITGAIMGFWLVSFISDNTGMFDTNGGYQEASYPIELLAWDIRLAETQSLDSFFKQAAKLEPAD